MASPWQAEEHPVRQGSVNIPRHLCHSHSTAFASETFSQHDLDDMRVFRESVVKLPKSEIENVVTSIQMVRPVDRDTSVHPHPKCLIERRSFQCIDGCTMDAGQLARG